MAKLIFLIFIIFIIQFVCIKAINQRKLAINQSDGEYNKVLSYSINAIQEFVIKFPEHYTKNPFIIKTWCTDCKKDAPVLIVLRQEKQVSSWQVPQIIESSLKDYLLYFNTSKTMCPDQIDKLIQSDITSPIFISESFMLTLATASPKPVNINVNVEEETNFYLKKGTEYSISISPSEPKFYYYAFEKSSTDTVTIEVNSDDEICLTVSVQSVDCPVLDTNKDITYEGKYQTINKKGALTIRKKEFPDGFILVFVAKPDNHDCSEKNSILPNLRTIFRAPFNRTSFIQFKIKNSINSKDYLYAAVGTLVVLLIFFILSLIIVCVFNKWGTISHLQDNIFEAEDDRDSIDQGSPISIPQINYLLKTEKLTVKSLTLYPKKDTKRSFSYLYHTFNIAIFYSIPVVQLVVTYQRMVNQTGNLDMCYYNFLCAHPSFGFSDFNHIYSNIGYIIIGLLFIIVTINRHAKVKTRFEIGIPIHYGIFYSMGVALIIEGVLSACYHICPSQANYQFDTSFMYVMAVLCMIKLYQNRHPDVNANATATFSLLGGAIFLAMLGILNGSLGVWIAFVIAYSALCIYISFKIYFFSYILEGLREFKQEFQGKGISAETFEPIKKGRFILLLIANLANYSMLITGLVLYNNQTTDFGTFLLGLLMGNAVIHAIFYTSMKLVHKERICMEAIIYGLLAVATWAAAAFFFLDAATLWTVTPAESRQWNQGCIVMNFYDKHDVWHLLSAPALYFSFMFMHCLDDDLINTKQTEMAVF